MSTQISKAIQMRLPLRQLRSMEACLTMDSLKTLASALVLSHIDYSNTAFVSLPKVATQRRFSVSEIKLWNNLPNSFKAFCRSLKGSYLFDKSFFSSY